MGQFREGFGLREVVVHAGDENVFQCDHPGLLLHIVLAGGRQLAQWILAVHRHDPVANFVRGAVQRNRQPELERLIGQPADLRSQPAGGHGDLARANSCAPARIEDFERLKQMVVIGERLAHAHDDQIVDRPWSVVRGRRLVRPVCNGQLTTED